jgi:energy-coupling factor transporter ATP-binding protein EcfA2
MATRHFLLVSGPSGGGKSTFIEQLAANALPDDIAAHLPSGCAVWPVIEANNLLKDKLPLETVLAAAGDHAILHYDIAYIHRFALPGYASDPAAALFDLGDRLDVVLVTPDADSLKQQFLNRQMAHKRRKGLARQLWGDWVRRPLRRALQHLKGRPARDTEELYLSADWLRDCYAGWRDFIQGLIASRPGARFIEVAPSGRMDGKTGFRLVAARRTPDRTAAH